MVPPPTTATSFFALIAGTGPGTGRSTALKFAKTYPVILLARHPQNYTSIVSEITSSGQTALGISTDVSDPSSVKNAFEEINRHKDFGGAGRKLAAVVYNVGGGFVRKPFLDLTMEEFEGGWEANSKGLFLLAQASLPLLLDSVSTSPYPPSLILTGATASVRGSAQCASFAQGKFAMRALGQSLAREFGPQGIHIAHAIIDGVIDIPRTSHYKVNDGVEDGKIKPEEIAEAYWNLHTQRRSAFTHEIDLRPFLEKF